MDLGVPKEIKDHEYRVGLTPASVRELTARGHRVFVESNAAEGIGFDDGDYRAAGAEICRTSAEVFERARLLVKVKEPLQQERLLLRPDHVLFTYLHLAADPQLCQDLIASGSVCIAYETVRDAQGRLPLLAPMSEVAGRLCIQAGAAALERSRGGRGILLGGVAGVEPGRVVILGGGVVGFNAAQMAVGLGADVTVLDRSVDVLRGLERHFRNQVKTLYATGDAIEGRVQEADLVIGAVLLPGAAAPKLVSEDLVRRMKKGAAVVDVAIDQGGCFETSRPTTHSNPTYIVHGVVHYCVANMPGAVARTSTLALNQATLPYVVVLAEKGVRRALEEDPCLRAGLNVAKGKLANESVARAHQLESADSRTIVSQLL